MKSDIEIARSAKLTDIYNIAKKAGIKEDEVIPWGDYKAKISLKILNRIKNNKDGKLILVTTINPTPEGEGKTTMTIGLAQALAKLGTFPALEHCFPPWCSFHADVERF